MLPENYTYSYVSAFPAFLGRLALGWYFAFAGWNKVVGEWRTGFGDFLRSDSFRDRTPSWLPEFIATPYGYALPWLELIAGVLLILGLFTRVSAGIIAVLLFTIGIALFGTSELFPRHHVLVFFPLALLLWQAGADRFTVDRFRHRRV